MKFAEIPQRLNPLLHPPDPIVINHVITVEELRQAETKKTACYDIDVEVDDTLKTQMNNFLLSTASQLEIQKKKEDATSTTSLGQLKLFAGTSTGRFSKKGLNWILASVLATLNFMLLPEVGVYQEYMEWNLCNLHPQNTLNTKFKLFFCKASRRPFKAFYV